LEVTKQLERDVDADRFTRLDRMLIAEQQGREFSDLRPDQDMRDTFRQNRALLIERARKLERRGWRLRSRPANGLYRQRPNRCCGSSGSAATSSRPCTAHWSAKGRRKTAIPPATSGDWSVTVEPNWRDLGHIKAEAIEAISGRIELHFEVGAMSLAYERRQEY